MAATMTNTSVWNPTEAGAKRTTLGWRTPTLPTFRMPGAPRPPQDRSSDSHVTRLTSELARSAEKLQTTRNYLGSAHGGWRLVETDGHRALFVPGTAESKAPTLPKILQVWPVQQVVLEPAFALVLNRMAAVGGEYVRLRFDSVANGLAAVLRVSTATPVGADSWATAEETLDVQGWHLSVVDVHLSLKLLRSALGRWPVTLRLGGPRDPAWLCTPEHRLAVMPMNAPGRDVVADYKVAQEDWSKVPTKRGKLAAKSSSEAVSKPAAKIPEKPAAAHVVSKVDSTCPLVIVAAEYAATNGKGWRALDVTERLRALVAGNALRLTVRNAVLGGDPWPGPSKVLRVTYRVGDGDARTVEVSERASLQLPEAS